MFPSELSTLSPLLVRGAQGLALTLSESQQTQLLAYVALLSKWNSAYNLTAIRDPQQMLIKHVLDALAVQPYLPDGGSWIDIGSGAGIPGVILAIADASRQWTLLDSNGKKVRFLTQAVLELGLSDRVQVVHARAQAHQGSYDGIIARAVMSSAEVIAMTRHLGAPQASWWLMKGRYPQQELDKVPANYHCQGQQLVVPMLDAQRWLIRCYPVLAKE